MLEYPYHEFMAEEDIEEYVGDKERDMQGTLYGEREFVARTIYSWPQIERNVSPMSRDLCRKVAFSYKLGEYCSLNAATIWIIHSMFNEKPDGITMADWFDCILRFENGIFMRVMENYSRKMKSQIEYSKEEVIHAVKVMKRRRKYLHLILNSKMEVVAWDDLVIYFKFLPITASRYMLTVSDCEHVILDRIMLAWARTMPKICRTQRIPSKAPKDMETYRNAELWVRRTQRVWYPGLTSREASLMIHSDEGLMAIAAGFNVTEDGPELKDSE